MFDSDTARDTRHLISLALMEDMKSDSLETGIDCTTNALVEEGRNAQARFVSRGEGIVCGIEVARLAIRAFAPRVTIEVAVDDGHLVTSGQTIATTSGPARDLLMMERTLLNFMGRLSGISTLTRRFTTAIEGTSSKVYDTRKTTPGFRRLEKYAVACGGGHTHRMGLYDAVLIKDNHLAYYQSRMKDKRETIPLVIRDARSWIDKNAERLPAGKETTVQLEVDSLEQLEIALTTPVDILLLDNMSLEMLQSGVKMRNRLAPKIELEASGGVNLKTVRAIAETGVERISVGGLTHSAINFDIGLDWQ